MVEAGLEPSEPEGGDDAHEGARGEGDGGADHHVGHGAHGHAAGEGRAGHVHDVDSVAAEISRNATSCECFGLSFYEHAGTTLRLPPSRESDLLSEECRDDEGGGG